MINTLYIVKEITRKLDKDALYKDFKDEIKSGTVATSSNTVTTTNEDK